VTGEIPERHYPRTYDSRRDTVVALLGAVLINVGIIALFMFITWFAYLDQ
jgi:hypothetical protein